MLLELLVVVAVIALLGALLLPVLARTTQKGRGTRCLDNLKQIATAHAMYSGDSREKLVYAALTYTGSGGVAKAWSWDDRLNSYIGGSLTDMQIDSNNPNPSDVHLPRSFLCPSDKIPASQPNVLRRSYGLPRHNMGAFALPESFPANASTDWPPSPINKTGVGLNWDTRNAPLPYWYPDDELGVTTPPAHQAAVFTSMVQDTERTILITESINPDSWVGRAGESYVDHAGAHFKSFPGATTQADQDAYMLTFHGPAQLNYLFVDAHAELLAREKTIGPTNALGAAPQSGMWTILVGD
ncbi:MAG: hypothetical protein AB1705_11210 [Verrucomicrobiota bacterium]